MIVTAGKYFCVSRCVYYKYRMSLRIGIYETSLLFLPIYMNLYLQELECETQIQIQVSALQCHELSGTVCMHSVFPEHKSFQGVVVLSSVILCIYLPDVVWSFLDLLIKWLLSWFEWFTNFCDFSVIELSACLLFTADCLVDAISLTGASFPTFLSTTVSNVRLSSY